MNKTLFIILALLIVLSVQSSRRSRRTQYKNKQIVSLGMMGDYLQLVEDCLTHGDSSGSDDDSSGESDGEQEDEEEEEEEEENDDSKSLSDEDDDEMILADEDYDPDAPVEGEFGGSDLDELPEDAGCGEVCLKFQGLLEDECFKNLLENGIERADEDEEGGDDDEGAEEFRRLHLRLSKTIQ